MPEEGLRRPSGRIERRHVEGLTHHQAFVVHEYPLWRDTLTGVLEELGFEVLLATAESDAAVARIRDVQPDLLVVGISEGLDGLECLRRARRIAGTLRAAVIAPEHDDDE